MEPRAPEGPDDVILNPPASNSAERLCAACGMCCNGVLFHGMAVQPEDSLRAMAAKGLKAKRRDGELQFLQPCPAHDGKRCRIYEDRPQRCRVFACRQLEGVFDGEIPESAAMDKIQEARRLSDRVRELLETLGDDRKTRPLATRCAGVFTPPLDPSPQADALRQELRKAMTALEEMLVKNFRIRPAG